MRYGLSGLAALALLLPGSLAGAQSTDSGDTQRQIEDLQSEVRELRALVLQGNAAAPRPVGAAGETFSTPKLQLRGFGHVEYDASRSSPRGPDTATTTDHFTNGGVDLFVTSQISERFSFLNETVFEAGEDGENVLDVERVLLSYRESDALQFTAGRGHTPFGYWNETFHHGAWTQRSVGRPLIYHFEDEGGILPVHFVGAQLHGVGDVGTGDLSYSLIVGNGRGEIPDQVQLVEDDNDGKMVAGLLRWDPSEGIGIGASALVDEIPGAPDLAAARAHRIDERILGVHAYYTIGPVELLSETQFLRHDDHTSSHVFRHLGGYVLASYTLGRVTPYYRFDYLDMSGGDPFFVDFGTGLPYEGVEDTREHTLGVGWAVAPFVTLKAEGSYLRAQSTRGPAGSVQAAFAF